MKWSGRFTKGTLIALLPSLIALSGCADLAPIDKPSLLFPLGSVLQEQLGTITSSFTKGMISSIIRAQGIAREHLRGFQLDLTATNGNSDGPVFCLATGHVFGALQSGPLHPQTGHVDQLLWMARCPSTTM